MYACHNILHILKSGALHQVVTWMIATPKYNFSSIFNYEFSFLSMGNYCISHLVEYIIHQLIKK